MLEWNYSKVSTINARALTSTLRNRGMYIFRFYTTHKTFLDLTQINKCIFIL